MQLCTGDKAIIVGAVAIAAYEYRCDETNLISMRVSAYRKHPLGRVLADTVILATALHLAEAVPSEWDIYHHLVRHFRRNVGPEK